MNIGRLEEVPLRELWKHEASDFTQWLAQKENLELLSDAIGITLGDAKINENVGKFFCDIVCKDDQNERMIIIENQLEQTDHDHLGKIITYASGVEASCIIWIVKKARTEHISAIQWLNSKTTADIGFFLIEIRAYRIGNSDAAPQFRIIEQPNAYSKSIQTTTANGELKRSETSRLAFWENFNNILEQRKETGLKIRKASTDHWYNFSIDSGLCNLSADLVDRDGLIRINLWISDSKSLYDFVHEYRSEIESKLQGIKLIWDRKDGKKASSVSTTFEGLNFDITENHNELANKIIDLVVKFKKVFAPIVKKFKE